MNKEKIFTDSAGIRGFLEAVGTALALFFLLNFVISPILGMVFPGSAGNYAQSVEDMLKTPVQTLFQVMVLAPLMEEFLYRGLALKWLMGKMKPAVAVILTALLFGILHFNLVQSISAAIAGLVLGAFYVRRRSLPLNIATHSIYNGLVLVYSLLII